jgi:hypothetical protein
MSYKLHDLLSYDQETGVIAWKVERRKQGGMIKVGDPAGTLNSDGYVVITVDGKQYKGHRLAFFLHKKIWPKGLIDHKNGVKNDNRWNNLREATNSVNSQNRNAPPKNSTTGLVGVRKFRDKFQASIKVPNEGRKHLGTFEKAEEASSAYQQAKLKYHPGAFHE